MCTPRKLLWKHSQDVDTHAVLQLAMPVPIHKLAYALVPSNLSQQTSLWGCM